MTLVVTEDKTERRKRRKRMIVPGVLLAACVALIVVVFNRSGAHDSLYRQPLVKVVVESSVGDVTVATTPSQAVVLSYRDRYVLLAPSVSERIEGSTLRVKISCPWSVRCSSDVVVTAGDKMDVEVVATGGSVLAQPRIGALNLSTRGGDVSVSQTDGPLTITTGSGDALFAKTQGALAVRTNTGKVTGMEVGSDAVDVITGSGAINLDFATSFRSVQAVSATGDIVMTVKQGAYRVDVSNPSSVTVKADSSASASIAAKTQGIVTVTGG